MGPLGMIGCILSKKVGNFVKHGLKPSDQLRICVAVHHRMRHGVKLPL